MRVEQGSLRDLVERAGQGDTGAFQELFDRYHDRVYRFARARLGGSDEGEDVLQDVFLAVWRGLPSFRYVHDGSFPGWLFGIARNVVGTRLRKRGRAVLVPLEDDLDGSVDFEDAALSRHDLAHELARLPDPQREVLLMRFVAGMTAREVAEAMGKSEGAVAALQVRGLKRLRRSMEGQT